MLGCNVISRNFLLGHVGRKSVGIPLSGGEVDDHSGGKHSEAPHCRGCKELKEIEVLTMYSNVRGKIEHI